MSRVYILNGPAGIGKDTLAQMLVQTMCQWGQRADRLEFKGALIRIAKAITGVSDGEWDRLYRRDQKERAQAVYGGLSARQLLIKISEEWVKPQFGKNHFGSLALADVNKLGTGHYFFSDGGFIEELLPMVEAGHHVTVLRLFRDGYQYAGSGDSRSYIKLAEAAAHGINVMDFELEDGNPGATVHEILLKSFPDYARRMGKI
ncbi:hypothetical protein Atoyac15_46 [Aeromonas phage Atoyac15]|uniref:Uncharacterized protein n=1 Tax=Aeromonas phage Atoyac15 TaxID=2767551 RepID=A0A866D1R8_9CAUD|nr:hypothetical protein Atoyac15_46 [Aeromonas phage Atoyac15]